MIIQFDPQRMHLQILCGTKEKYEPNEVVDTIQTKVDALKAEMAKFRDEVLNPGLDEINKLIAEENKKFTPTQPK
jgi:hypothetical protein